MKKMLSLALCATLLGLMSACNGMNAGDDEMAENFRNIPEGQRMAVYWYWISDNISKEGVVKDLEAMKEKGIGRAYIGNIWEPSVKPGDIKVMTDEWWEVVHAALKRASELDIEIGLFNCPGWSQSGGPWIKPEQAMRYLDSQSMEVEGNGAEQTIRFQPLSEDAQDVLVLAYPSLAQNKYVETIDKKANEDLCKDCRFDAPMKLRSVTFEVEEEQNLSTSVDIQVPENGDFRTLKTVRLERYNYQVNVGFHPKAPICVSIPDTETEMVRLSFHGGGNDVRVQVTMSDEPRVERYEEKSLGKMFQSPLPMWDEYMWETQPEPQTEVVQAAQVQNLTAQFQNDCLKWTVPEGKWTILRTSMRPTGVTNGPAAPDATGLEVDKMSREHVATHFDAFLGEVLRRIPAEDRTSFKVVVEDSYEMGGQNWTDDMAEVFQERYGYDPIPFLPTLYGKVIGSQDQSERFLWDLRRLVADRVAYDYVGGLRDISHEHNLTTWLECYGHWGFPGEFLMYGGQSDEVGGEFWSEGDLGNIENRAASSCAHIYGKPKVWAESCTAGGPVYHRYPCLMKSRTDRFFTEGINSTLLHLYIQQPDETTFPGISAWFGNEFNRKNIWWEQMDLFTDYLRRCNYMLQQGRYIADLAYFIGEDAPKMTGQCDPAVPRGYSFDYINAEVLEKYAHVEKGALALDGGMKYRVLVLPNQQTMRPELLQKIASFVEQGLTVVGPQPTSSPSLQNYPQADADLKALAEEMWASGTYGQGRIYGYTDNLQPVLDELGIVPDCYVAPETPVTFIHRTTDGGEVYFLSNQCDKDIAFDAEFRVTGMVPNLWHPVTVDQRALSQFQDNGMQTKVPMRLAPNESVFLVFRKGSAPKDGKANFPEPTVLATVDTPWMVQFQSELRGPAEPQTFAQLTDWSTSEDESIRYYAGKAIYTNTLELNEKPDAPLYIDLGNVMVMAKVYVNDEYAGGAWTYPYHVNVTDYLKPGTNTLRVEVVNNWQNRLIGDQKLPEEERRTYATVNPWSADSELQSSGLLGPVQLMKY